jgi:hypothetical protein
VQGVVILRQPLASSSSASTENYLIANYEYSPAARNVDGYVVGGRVQQWLGDTVRVGVTGTQEKTADANQRLAGADIRIQSSDGTYVEAEVARSRGPGFENSQSSDGGLTIQSNGTAGTTTSANAYRAEARVDIAELSDDAAKGEVIVRIEQYQKGFSSPTKDATQKETLWGVEGNVDVTDKAKAAASYSEKRLADGSRDRQAVAKVQARLTDEISVEPFAKYTEKKLASTATSGEQGKRADAGVKLIYAWDDDNQVYGYGQGTVKHTGTLDKDNRVGVGGKKRLSEKLTAEAEASTGNQGLGGFARLNYEPTADDRYYLGYNLDYERSSSGSWPFALVGSDMGSVVAGTKHKFNDQWSAYAEDNVDLFGKRTSLTQAYGVTYTPDVAWSATAGAEFGDVLDSSIDPTTLQKNPDIQRRAISLSIGYKDEGLDGKLKGEARHDNSEDDAKDTTAYLLQASLGLNMSENWRAIGSFDGVFTRASDDTKEGDYAEGSVGFAYRGTTSDKFNALAKYTFLYDKPAGDQVSVDGTTSSPSQRSHILSADVSYDVVPQLTLGAKYGMRVGDVRERTVGARWQKSQVHLGILRADWHIVNEWDAMLEGRVMWSPTSEETDYGLVAAVYRHFGENMKVGLGYNFGQFSDDLRDLSQNDHGVFLNVIGKF